MADPDDEPSLAEEVAELRAAVEDLESRTVPRAAVEADLRRYVRGRARRGHARGWGPYLVLLYGTVMTVGAFYLLSGGWAVLAMVVVWLSTLGLYVLLVLFGALLGAAELPSRGLDRLRDRWP
jgi:Flp pilus assembly protein TadB